MFASALLKILLIKIKGVWKNEEIRSLASLDSPPVQCFLYPARHLDLIP
jgi:hypothetical protein